MRESVRPGYLWWESATTAVRREARHAHDVQFRLIGQPSPAGQIRAADLIAIASSIKDLTYRLTRAAADAQGLGRTTADLEALAQVRVSLASGSTLVLCRIGDLNALDVDLLEAEVDRMLWDIVNGMSTAHCPASVSETVSEAAGDLAVALRQAATDVEVVVGGRPAVRVTKVSLSRDVWTSPPPEDLDSVPMQGELRAVDLDSHRFRLVDDVGTKIELEHVEDAPSVAGLVETRVQAVGRYVPARGAKRARLNEVVIAPAGAPFRIEQALTIADLGSRVADQDETLDLAPQEVEQFLAGLRD